MPRALPTLLPADLELRLLRKSVGALTADRATCVDCGRTPLAGERIHLFGVAPVCALCASMRPDTADRVERVHHCEHGHTVKVRAA